MMDRIETVLIQYESLNMRERILIGVTICAVSWLLWQLSFSSSLKDEITGLQNQVNNVSKQIEAEVNSQRTMSSVKPKNSTNRLQAERVTLQLSNAELEAQLTFAMQSFVYPDKMPDVLEDLLSHHKALKLVRLASIPAVPIRAQNVQEEETLANQDSVVLFRHAVSLEISGGYFDLVDYLADLERSPWHFIWRDLEYQVEEYPRARVLLTLETLSRDPNWIGV